MKATGIIRRIDELGRVVIPREIRRTLGICDGDPLELYTDEMGVYFRRYNGREEAMKRAFEPMFLALYKTGYKVALYANAELIAGGHSVAMANYLDLTHINIGVWGGYEWAIAFNADDFACEDKAMSMLDMLALSMKEVARELYGED